MLFIFIVEYSFLSPAILFCSLAILGTSCEVVVVPCHAGFGRPLTGAEMTYNVSDGTHSFTLAVLDPRVGHTMDVLSPFISVLCHSD